MGDFGTSGGILLSARIWCGKVSLLGLDGECFGESG